MGFVISGMTAYQMESTLYEYQNDLTFVVNSLMKLTSWASDVTLRQNALMQAELAEHTDEEGHVDMDYADYLNSAAFTGPFEAELAQIHAKEQDLEQKKISYETKIKELTTAIEGWDKQQDKNASEMFKYGL